MKTLFYYILGAAFALLNEGCQTVAISGNGNRVVLVKTDASGSSGRYAGYPRPDGFSPVDGGDQIITIRNHQTGQIVWQGLEYQIPPQFRAGWKNQRPVATYSNGLRPGGASPGMFTGLIGGHKVYDSQYPNGAWVP